MNTPSIKTQVSAPSERQSTQLFGIPLIHIVISGSILFLSLIYTFINGQTWFKSLDITSEYMNYFPSVTERMKFAPSVDGSILPEVTVLDRFVSYAETWTTSDMGSTNIPSTPMQTEFQKRLALEMLSLGMDDVEVTGGAVYGRLPGNSSSNAKVAFIAHVDTSPESSGKDVEIVVHSPYQSGDVILESGTIIPEGQLDSYKGRQLVTSKGYTLIGCDDKCGIAAIMGAIQRIVTYNQNNEEQLQHPEIVVAFGGDEEIGGTSRCLSVEKLNADFGYTIDGGERARIDVSTFNAKMMTVHFDGLNVHTGYASQEYNPLRSAVLAMGYFVSSLADELPRPEGTRGDEGFVHVFNSHGDVTSSTIDVLIRSYSMTELEDFEDTIKELVAIAARKASANHPDFPVNYHTESVVQYLNLENYLSNELGERIVDAAVTATAEAGLIPYKHNVRGGTDGAWLSSQGVPTPNIFVGAANLHSTAEFTSVEDLQELEDTVYNLMLQLADIHV